MLGLLQVSVMMQYFKRPWNIQEYIARLQACQVRTCQQQAIDICSIGDRSYRCGQGNWVGGEGDCSPREQKGAPVPLTLHVA